MAFMSSTLLLWSPLCSSLRAGQGRPHDPRRHAVEDPGGGREARRLCAPRPMIPAFQGFLFGGGEGFIRLAYSWEPPERNYEGAKLIAQAIKNAR
jgi:hypothetical protein